MPISALSFAVIVTGVGESIVSALTATPESGGAPSGMRIVKMTPGSIAWDGCDCGQLISSIVRIAPATRLPLAGALELRNGWGCHPHSMAAEVIVSLQRCVAGLDNFGKPPQPAAQYADALRQQGDAFAMRKGITCRLEEYLTATQIDAYLIGETTFPGPDGKCAAVNIPFFVLIV